MGTRPHRALRAHRAVRAVRGIREARRRNRSSPCHLINDAGYQLAEISLGVLAFLVAEIEAAPAEEGEADGTELRMHIAQLGFAVRALPPRLAMALIIAMRIRKTGKMS